MKRQITILFALVITAYQVSAQTSRHKTHYFSKLFPESGLFLRPDSLPDGEWIAFCETNKTQIGLKLHYKNGNRNGESISYWSNGNIQQKEFYKDGCLVGKNEKWYKNAIKESESSCEVDNFKMHTYHCNIINYWTKDGKQLIKDGTGMYVSYHDNDTLQVTGEYINGLCTGKWTWYHDDGTLQYIEHYIIGKQDGEYIFYHRNGQIRSKGMYSQGKRIGKWEDWYENGNPEQYEYMVDGKRDGDYKYWHPNGQLSSFGSYVLGFEDGIWKHWNEEGKLETEERYSKGKLIETHYTH